LDWISDVVVVAVIPAKAGIHLERDGSRKWLPAFAGMATGKVTARTADARERVTAQVGGGAER
jgi:hypothetical protein